MPVGPRPPIPPGFAKVVLGGSIFTHQWKNIFYLQVTGGAVTINDLTTLATDIATEWNTTMGTILTPDTVLTSVQIVYVPSVGNELQAVWTGTHAGTNATTTIQDASAAWVLNWPIGAYYRGGHPRWYVAGVAANAITNGSDGTGTVPGNLATQANNLRNYINGLTLTSITALAMGTLSFSTGGAWRATPIFRAFTGVSTRHKLGSQRRRILS